MYGFKKFSYPPTHTFCSSFEAKYDTLRSDLLLDGTQTAQTLPWPNIQYEEEWDRLVLNKGTGWDWGLDAEYTTSSQQVLPQVVTDSTDIKHSKPLYAKVADKVEVWESIGAPPIILEWIRTGVHFPMDSTPPNFFHKQLPHEDAALQYWASKLLPHYLESGAIEEIAPPTKN